ncbi:MAG: nitrogen regulation protein NR(I), partial [Pseudomonadales bacterium]|nr:nitrogen regulation protein NR(I) [Pseudomonadales bacterium]
TGREVLIDDLPPELLEDKEQDSDSENWEKSLRTWASRKLAQIKPGDPGLLDSAVPRFERIMIESALKQTGGRKRDASILLGWGRNTLTRKINELGMNDTQLLE